MPSRRSRSRKERAKTLPSTPEPLAIDNGNRHLDPIAGGGPQALTRILCWIVAAQHFVLLQERGLARAGVVIEDARRCNEALVAIAVGGGVIVRRAGRENRVDRFRKGDWSPIAGRETVDAQVIQGLRFLHGNREILEQIDFLDANTLAVGDEHLPALGVAIAFGSRQQREVPPESIAADIEQSLAVIQVIAVLLLARQEDRKALLWRPGPQIVDFGGVLGFDLQEEVLLIARFAKTDIVKFVLLFAAATGSRRPPAHGATAYRCAW